MTLEPLLNASPAIQFHVLTVVPAALIGGVMLFRRKGTPALCLAGLVWVCLMVLTALSSFFIHTIKVLGPFSPIHVLSLLTLSGAFIAVRSTRQRNFVRHQRVVKALHFGGIGIAGFFALMPGRIMYEVVFGAGSSVDATAAAASPAVQVAGAAPVWVWPLMLLPAMLMGSMLITVLTGKPEWFRPCRHGYRSWSVPGRRLDVSAQCGGDAA